MKKGLIFGIITVVVIIAGIVTGIFLYSNNSTSEFQTKAEKQLAEDNKLNYEIKQTSSTLNGEKISIDTVLKFNTYYKECKHTSSEEVNASEELVNKTEEEIQSKYEDWRIKKFNSKEVIFYREKEGICPEHYILRENNGYLTIYNINSEGKEVLYETTGIVTSYLPETDINRLKQGIIINSKEELYSTLEDYE